MARRSRWATQHAPLGAAVPALLACVVLITLNLSATKTGRSPLAAPTSIPPAEPRVPDPPSNQMLDHGEVAEGRWDHRFWMGMTSSSIDSTTLAAAGVIVPAGANVFAARIVGGSPSPAYMLYEAGGGAFSTGFYPASSVKILAAVGALELAYTYGFSGEATVDGTFSLWEYYDAAIRRSSNEDYDELVRLAGVAWLNQEFLPSRGYRATRIQEAYAGGEGVTKSRPFRLSEEGREIILPERSADDDYGCAAINCSTLFELADAVRRVVLNDEIPAEERFKLAPGDVVGLRVALLGAESWIGPGVVEALGPEASIYSKPGWTSGHDCVDISLVVDGRTGYRYLIGMSAPDDGECAMLATMAFDVLTVLSREAQGTALRTDGSSVEVVNGQQRAPQP